MSSKNLYPNFSRRKPSPKLSENLYTPLVNSSEWIRIVTIHPNEENALIACSLEVAKLDVAQFEALSYCWGDEADMGHIYINGCLWPVTSNLHAALKALRHSEKPRKMWIDAICINQKDDKEKSRQVEIMADIYSQATLTVAWIGPSTESTEEAFDFFQHVQEYGPEDDDVQDFLNDPESCDALLDIVKRPYWSRLWVVQEYILSQYIVVQCGKFKVTNWDIGSFGRSDLCQELRNRIKALNTSLQEVVRFFHGPYSIISVLSFLVARLEDLDSEELDIISFYELMYSTQRHQCKDPRDKLYGILSLTALHPTERNLKIRPDYTLDVLTVYQNFVIEHIRWSQSLMMLEKAGLQRGATKISWVPDLTHDGWETRHIAETGMYSACGTLPAECNFDQRGKLLTPGLRCDIVRQTKTLDPSMTFAARVKELLDLVNSVGTARVLETVCYLMIDINKGKEDEFMPLLLGFCFIIGDITAMSDNIKVAPPNTFLEYYNLYAKKWTQRSLLSAQEKLQLFMDDFPSLSFVTDWPIGILDSDQSTSFVQQFTSQGRLNQIEPTFFTTSNGLIGCSGNMTVTNDHIFVLPGGTNPFLLRETLPGYVLVDYCFVHGMMQGEMIKLCEEGQLSMENIILI